MTTTRQCHQPGRLRCRTALLQGLTASVDGEALGQLSGKTLHLCHGLSTGDYVRGLHDALLHPTGIENVIDIE